jgi:hypothetical protein
MGKSFEVESGQYFLGRPSYCLFGNDEEVERIYQHLSQKQTGAVA